MLNKMLRALLCSQRLMTMVIICTIAFNPARASLLIPPADMNDMISHTDYIVYGEVLGHLDKYGTLNSFIIKESFKGSLSQGQIIRLQEYGSRTDAAITTVQGDVDFQIGSSYLLFLYKDQSGSFKARLLSLSVFKEILNHDQRQFVHLKSILDLCFMNQVDESLIGSYRADDFKVALREKGKFNQKSAGYLADFPQEDLKVVDQRSMKKSTCARPSHCVTLEDDEANLDSNCKFNSPAKHQSSNFVIKVASGAASDPSEPNALAHLATAANELNNLPGISVTMASPVVQTCAIVTCNKVSDVTFNTCNPTRQNEIWVFFNDPCDEIPDLINCGGAGGGLVGRGGTWVSSLCHDDPCMDKWRTAIVPYFVMNNGAGCLSDYNYIAAIIHETMHGLYIGHFAGTCNALMNEFICNANDPAAPNYGITQLDIDCIEWMYNQCPVNENFAGVTYPNSYTDPEFAQNQISASNILVQNGADISYNAGSTIKLDPLFEVELGAVFHALIGGCVP